MTATLIGAVAGAVLAFLVNWVLTRRDEARVGGAAERQLRADFQSSLEVLEASPRAATEAWLNPGIRITTWREHFDRLVPRFRPALWNQMNDAVDALDRLQAWAEVHSTDGKPTAAPDASVVTDTTRKLKEIVGELDTRYEKWLRWQPWLRERWPVPAALWNLLVGLVLLVTLAAIVSVTVSKISDPITAGDIEQELREMQPNAALVNCAGDDSKDRWTCVVTTKGCETAALAPQACERESETTSRLQVDADKGDEDVLMRLTRQALGRAGEATTRKRHVWFRSLRRTEAQVDLATP